MPLTPTYDPGNKPSATTNRLDPKLATMQSRQAGNQIADCAITISGTSASTSRTLTIQFKDMLGRNYRGVVAFEILQINGALGSAAVASAGGINPVVAAGVVLREIVSVTDYLMQTNGSGLATVTIDQNSGTDQSFSIICGGQVWNTGTFTWA